MEALLPIVVFGSGITVGWFLRGYRSVSIEEIARVMEAADRDEPIAERVRRASGR